MEGSNVEKMLVLPNKLVLDMTKRCFEQKMYQEELIFTSASAYECKNEFQFAT